MSAQGRIWDACGAVGDRVDEDVIVAAAGVSRATVRRYLRYWALAGHLAVHRAPTPFTDRRYGRQREVRTIEKRRDGRHPLVTFDCGGQLIYVAHPSDDDRFTTISSYRGRYEVSHRQRVGDA